MSIDNKANDAVDTDITAAIAKMTSCTFKDSDNSAHDSKAVLAIRMDIDVTTKGTTQADKMDIDLAECTHFGSRIYPSTIMAIEANVAALDRSIVRTSERASKPQHKRIARLVGVDARSRAPAAFSLDRLDRAVSASVRHGGMQPVRQSQGNVRSQERQSRLVRAAIEFVRQKGS